MRQLKDYVVHVKTIVTYIGTYLLNILIWIDQGFNTILGGDPDHTVSGRVEYNATLGYPWAIKLEKWINFVFFWQPDHCNKSIEWFIVRRKWKQEKKKVTQGK